MADDTGNVNDGVVKPDSDEAILTEARERLTACMTDESIERNKMLDDLRFATLDQWPDDVRTQRENDPTGRRPCLTIDQINQYITQVANDMRQNRPGIKTRPVDDGADPDTARIFQGLVRHIEDQSSAQIAYATAGESAVTIGLGFFRIKTDYVNDTSFDQEILIERVPDTFSVYLAPHLMPDGSDAEYGFISVRMALSEFKRKYPGKKYAPEDFAGLGDLPSWRTDDSVTVVEYFYKRHEERELLFLADGSTVEADKFDGAESSITGRRKTQKRSVKWCILTGAEILEKRDWNGKYIPIVEVVGKEKMVEGKRLLWGLVRPAKDALRAFNYWISALTEKMALAPKAPFIGAVGQFATQGAMWDQANVRNYSRLEYDPIDVNGNALPAPRRQEPMQMEPAMAQMLAMMQNNVKSSLGMYKAAIGEAESQQSGRAILALKKESDTGTMHFGDNQSLSITHAGRIIVDLIPHYYDTARVLRILGEDGSSESATIDPTLKGADGKPVAKKEIREGQKIRKIYNLGVGTYDVVATTGPSYTTGRQEAATVFTELAQAAKDPATAAALNYLAVRNSDFSGSDEALRMLKALLPPQLQQKDGETAPIPPEAQQQIAELSQRVQLMDQAGQQLAQENEQLKSDQQAEQAKLQSAHQLKMQELALKAQEQSAELKLAREKAEAEMQLKAWLAEQEIAIKKQVAGQEMQNAEKELQHGQLIERIGSLTELLNQFEVAAQASSKQSAGKPRQ